MNFLIKFHEFLKIKAIEINNLHCKWITTDWFIYYTGNLK